MLARLSPAAFLLLPALPLRAQSLPAGFSVEVVSSGHTLPVGLAFLPDGRIVLIEQNVARVKVITPAAAVGTLGTIPNVNPGGERGLLGVTVDPQWPARPYLYFYYSHTSPTNQRIVMYDVTGDLANPGSQTS